MVLTSVSHWGFISIYTRAGLLSKLSFLSPDNIHEHWCVCKPNSNGLQLCPDFVSTSTWLSTFTTVKWYGSWNSIIGWGKKSVVYFNNLVPENAEIKLRGTVHWRVSECTSLWSTVEAKIVNGYHQCRGKWSQLSMIRSLTELKKILSGLQLAMSFPTWLLTC